MSEPYSAAPAPGSQDGRAYVPGRSAGADGPTTTAYAPVAPRVTAGVGQAYAEAIARAGGTAQGGAPTPSGGTSSGVAWRRRGRGFRFPGTEALDPAQVFAGPGYQAPRPARSGMATWALTLALLGFIPFLSPVAVGLGLGALGETESGEKSGRGRAEAAVSLGAMGTIGWLLILTAYLVNR